MSEPNVSPFAGKLPPDALLINVPRLISRYFTDDIDPENPASRISFGTSGHRGSPLKKNFNEAHILAIVQAVCEFRKSQNITGPLFLGIDTHALSEPAFETTLEVLAGNGVVTMIDQDLSYTPTPVVSHAILCYNRKKKDALADGIIITPSHNPPCDGGIKYNPPNGGPAESGITKIIEARANELLKTHLREVKRVPFEQALKAATTHRYDYSGNYIADLENIVDMRAIAGANLKIAADALGGSGVHYWAKIADYYKFKIDTFNTRVDPTFSFMCVDRDGKIRMDPSSPYAVAGLLEHAKKYDIAFGNDADFDRHGIVVPAGLMQPNSYLAVSIEYLFSHRPNWRKNVKIGKTLVSSSIIDRLAAEMGRDIAEVPVGFKYFVDGLYSGDFGFAGEESAGGAFLRKDGTVWTTDKDGIIMDLLACEMTAVTGERPDERYAKMTARLGTPFYTRTDSPTTPELKRALLNATPENVKATTLAGEKIEKVLTRSPHGNSPLGGLKVVTKNGFFASRPSGTEDICKLYAESFIGPDHLQNILDDAEKLIAEL